MILSIRRFRPRDATAAHRVYYRAVHEGAARFYDEDQRAAWAPSETPGDGFAERAAAMITYVAEDDGNIVGFMTMEHDGHLDLAFVLPEYMGRGVSTMLLEQLIAEARDLDLAKLWTEASHLARRFLEKHGWHVTEPETILHNGQVLERFRMALTLEESR